MQTIWANNNVSPSILYFSNGNLYDEDNWSIVNGVVTYRDGGTAMQTEIYNVTIPSLPVTSFVTDATGSPNQYVNSEIGIISVIKADFTEEQLRALALNIEATMGKNPCVQTF